MQEKQNNTVKLRLGNENPHALQLAGQPLKLLQDNYTEDIKYCVETTDAYQISKDKVLKLIGVAEDFNGRGMQYNKRHGEINHKIGIQVNGTLKSKVGYNAHHCASFTWDLIKRVFNGKFSADYTLDRRGKPTFHLKNKIEVPETP